MHGKIGSTADLGRALLAARIQHQLTQTQLAQALGVTQRYISEIETGKPKNLGPKLFEVLDQVGIELSFRTMSHV